MIFNWDEWTDLYKPDPNKDHKVIRHKTTSEKRFQKSLRGNDANRAYELISELNASIIFSKLEIGVLDAQPVLREGKPVIVMRFVEDATILDLDSAALKDQIVDKDKFATNLFLSDLLVNNTNRDKNKLAHVGWERREDGKIYLLPLDNGQTLGHGNDTTLDTDNDLEGNLTERFNNHFSSLLLAAPDTGFATAILSNIEEVNFDEVCEQVRRLIVDTLAPIKTEEDGINERVEKVKAMLNRRRPVMISKVKQWMNIDSNS